MEGLEGGGGNCENHQGPGGWGNEKSQERSTAVKPDGRDAERSQLERDGTAFGRRALRIVACASNSRDLAEHQNTS